jgi:hypothetical protein
MSKLKEQKDNLDFLKFNNKKEQLNLVKFEGKLILVNLLDCFKNIFHFPVE